MSTTREAVDSIKQLAARLEGIVQVSQLLERIGSLEDAEHFAQSRLENARAAAADAEAIAASLAASRDTTKRGDEHVI